MAGLPDVTIAGTVTADPEMHFTPSGAGVANFTVASNDRRYNRETQRWDDAGATFLRCTAWRQLAENIAESLRKGVRVIVTGQLRQRSYETPEGEKRTVYEVDVTEVGPSLKWATAKVVKAARTTDTAAEQDAWSKTSLPASPADGASDEPPF